MNPTQSQNDDIRKDYWRLFGDGLYYFDRIDGEIQRCKDDRYEWLIVSLIRIQQFMAEVLASEDAAFRLVSHPGGYPVLCEGALARYFSEVWRFSMLQTQGYVVSEEIQLFFECWHELELGREAFAALRGDSSVLGREPFERFNDFLMLIRHRGRSPEFRRRLSRRNERSAENQRCGEKYLNDLFTKTYSKLLVLRVDFSYLRQFAEQMTPEQARREIGCLFKEVQRHRVLGKHFMGYLWKLEWTRKKGCHFHCIIVYDGHEARKDIVLAQLLGEFWSERITNGRGIYWNCNRHKEDYAYLGIGQIRHNDKVKRSNLINYVLNYLTKTDQYLLADAIRQGRCFQPGHTLDKGIRARKVMRVPVKRRIFSRSVPAQNGKRIRTGTRSIR